MTAANPVALIRAIADHLQAVELRVRNRPLDERDVAAIRVQIEAAQWKICGALALLARC